MGDRVFEDLDAAGFGVCFNLTNMGTITISQQIKDDTMNDIDAEGVVKTSLKMCYIPA